MELVSCSPFMTSWEGIRASLHDHRLHQNQGSWGVRMGSAPTVDHKHLLIPAGLRSRLQLGAGRLAPGCLCESAKKSLRQGCRQLLYAHSAFVSPTFLPSSLSLSSSPLRAAVCCYAITLGLTASLRPRAKIPLTGQRQKEQGQFCKTTRAFPALFRDFNSLEAEEESGRG